MKSFSIIETTARHIFGRTVAPEGCSLGELGERLLALRLRNLVPPFGLNNARGHGVHSSRRNFACQHWDGRLQSPIHGRQPGRTRER